MVKPVNSFIKNCSAQNCVMKVLGCVVMRDVLWKDVVGRTHEIAHVTQRHTANQQRRGILPGLLSLLGNLVESV